MTEMIIVGALVRCTDKAVLLVVEDEEMWILLFSKPKSIQTIQKAVQEAKHEMSFTQTIELFKDKTN